jgi:RNA polymerase sigma factor (sigma-70 family)
MMIEDAELLRRFAEDHSEAAFGELVQRHLRLVYFAALRQVGGDAHRANDVAQSVFTDLARKARGLTRHGSLTGWLYTSTHYAAAKAVRAEQRRQAREQEAHRMQDIISPSEPSADWDRLRPVLDDVMLQLNDRDREAVLLRYFEDRPFAEVGARLRLSEDAARMRVERALDKLRRLLAQRGVASTSAALGLALTSQAGLAAPAGLAGAVTVVALSAAATAVAPAGLFTFFAMSKLSMTVSSALALAGIGGLVMQQHANAQLRRELSALQTESEQISVLRAENAHYRQVASEVALSHQDDAELARLRQEIAALKTKLAAAAATKRAEEAKAAAAAAQAPRLDREPSVRSFAKPIYPEALRRAGLEAEVQVSFVVDAQGNAQNVTAVATKVRRGEPVPGQPPLSLNKLDPNEFLTAASTAVQQWKFEAGQKGGRSVNTRMQIPLVFAGGKTTADLGIPAPQELPPGNWF